MTRALTAKEIAALESLSPDAIYRAIQAGDLPARKVCGRLRVDETEYEAWKQRHRVEPTRPGPMFTCLSRSPAGSSRGNFLKELQAMEETNDHGA